MRINDTAWLWNPKLSVALVCVVGPCTEIQAEITREQAIAVAQSVCLKVGSPFDPETAKAQKDRSNTSWKIHFSEISVCVSNVNGRLITYSDRTALMAAESNAKSSARFYSNEAEIWTRAELVARRFSFFHRAVRGRMLLPRSASNPRGAINGTCSMAWEELAYGISTDGAGNRMAMSLDARNGKVASISVKDGITWDPPTVRITKAQAKQAAARLMGAEAPDAQIRLRYILGNGEWRSVDGPRQFAQRRLRYVWQITLSREAVWIDAETGNVMGGLKNPTRR